MISTAETKLLEENEGLRTDLRRLLLSQDTLVNSNAALTRGAETLMRAVADSQVDQTELRRRLSAAESEMGELQKSLSYEKGLHELSLRQVTASEIEATAVRQRLEKALADLEHVRLEAKSHQAELNTAYLDLKVCGESREKLQVLSDQIEPLKQLNTDLRVELLERVNQIGTLKEQLASLQSRLSDLGDAHRQHLTLMGRFKGLRDKYIRSVTELRFTREDNARLSDNLERLQNAWREMQRDLRSSSKDDLRSEQVEPLETNLASMRGILDQLTRIGMDILDDESLAVFLEMDLVEYKHLINKARTLLGQERGR